MIRFSEFLLEQATARVGIEHLDKMNPMKFIQLINAINKQYNGILSKDKIDISEKIDGSSLRFGIDPSGKTFIESSYSGPIFDDGGYSKYVQIRGHQPSKLSKGFDNLLKEMKKDSKLQNLLKKHNVDGIKIIGELLYMPFGIKDAGKVQFVKIKYEEPMLGTEWTFVPFKVLTFDNMPHKDENLILSELYKSSTKARMYVPPSINIETDIDLSIEISEIKTNIIDKYTDLEEILKSRKKIHADIKYSLKEEISKYQSQVSKKIISFINKGVFGNSYEGLVIKLEDGSIFKIVTSEFKDSEFNDGLTK